MCLLLLLPLIHAMNISFSDQSNLVGIANQITDKVIAYYPPNDSGAFPKSTDSSSAQWFESGMMWTSVFSHVKETGNQTYAALATQALVNASFGTTADFLGPVSLKDYSSTVEGKWNDDILWWGFGAMTGVEMYGKTAIMPGGNTYFQLVSNTYYDVAGQTDSLCGGGYYWARDRNAVSMNQRTYKSTISNAEILYMSLRLYSVTSTQFFMDNFVTTYAWLKSSQIISTTWRVSDGVGASDCVIGPQEYTYNYGMMLSSLALAYSITKTQAYMDDAKSILAVAITRFTKNNIIYDDCNADQRLFKSILIRGLKDMYLYTNDLTTKATIKTMIETNAQAMVAKCDANWNCDSWWGGGRVSTYNVHTQLNSMVLMEALVAIEAPNLAVTKVVSAPVDSNSVVAAKSGEIGVGCWDFVSLLGIMAIF